MLELIVLGQIPGTEIVLTLTWVLVCFALLGALGTLNKIRKHSTAVTKTKDQLQA